MFSSTDHNQDTQNKQSLHQPAWLSLKAGLLYFAIVFGIGCVLGPIRILWVVPVFGPRLAELLEMPLMLMAIIVAANWIVRRLAVPSALWPRLSMGLVALGCLLIAEWGLVLQLRGLSIAEYIATRDPVAGMAYEIMLCLFAVMPWLIARKEH